MSIIVCTVQSCTM